MRGAVAALVMAAACGHLGYDPAASLEGGPDGSIDGGLDGGGPLGPFGEPRPLAELSAPGAVDDDPSLTGDLLEIYFKSDRGGGGDFDIWMAVRATPDEPFGPPSEVAELSSPAFDATPEVSADGLTMYLSSYRAGSASSDVYFAARTGRDQPWSVPVRVPELCTGGDDYSVVTDGAGLRAIVTRRIPERDMDLLETTRAAAGDPWRPPATLEVLSGPGWDADATLSPDGRLVVFASDRPGGGGQKDLWLSSRVSPEAPWSEPVDLRELATPQQDEDPWLSGDGRTLVFSSDRGGRPELWMATR